MLTSDSGFLGTIPVSMGVSGDVESFCDAKGRCCLPETDLNGSKRCKNHILALHWHKGFHRYVDPSVIHGMKVKVRRVLLVDMPEGCGRPAQKKKKKERLHIILAI